jgi:hypothetical protein
MNKRKVEITGLRVKLIAAEINPATGKKDAVTMNYKKMSVEKCKAIIDGALAWQNEGVESKNG